MSSIPVYEATGVTLEEAVSTAHALIPLDTPGHQTDHMRTRVVEWGKRTGGFVQENLFWVRIIQVDPPPVLEN